MESPDSDPHDLARFVEAQATTYDRALAELRLGRKESHWMWFIFPQIAGLGQSPMARRYAIRSLREATAYLAHPVLGPRLLECAEAVLAIEHRPAIEVFGQPDDVKLRSSATLFALVSQPPSIFDRVIDKYFGGERDDRTIRLVVGT